MFKIVIKNVILLGVVVWNCLLILWLIILLLSENWLVFLVFVWIFLFLLIILFFKFLVVF